MISDRKKMAGFGIRIIRTDAKKGKGEQGMRIEFGKRCSMMKEAMSLLEFAVNVDETERRRYLSKLGRFGEEKEPGILLQKELLELSGQIPVTEPMRRYFERYQENSLGCLARNLLCTFDAEEADNAQEMKEKGLDDDAIAVIEPVLTLKGSAREKISAMRPLMDGGSVSGAVSETGLAGLDELEELFGLVAAAGISQEVELDLSLARGLNYYTGAIFEVKARDFQIGSICGGGRYDNLTGIFGLPDMSGVGISFGADRIYDVLKGLGKFPEDVMSATKVLFAYMGGEETMYLLPVAKALRDAGVPCEIYPDQVKLKKQFDYADRKSIPFISITGEEERLKGLVNLKNLSTGEQKSFPAGDIDGMLAFIS